MTFEYVEARTLAAATDALAAHGRDARVIAGGQALVTLIRQGLVAPRALVSVRYLAEGRGIRLDGGEVAIGGMATHREVERDPLVAAHVPVLAEMEAGLASPQVRNAGTIGGNLCHADPAEDPAAVLLALGASVELASRRGRRRLPLAGFLVDYLTTALEPDELLLTVRVPRRMPRAGAAYLKHSTRNAVDFPVAGVAAWVRLGDGRSIVEARVAIAGVAPTAVLCPPAAEAAIGGADASRVAEAVRAYVEPRSDAHASAEYKRHIAGVLAERAFGLAVARAEAA